MSRAKIVIPKKVIQELYWGKNLSLAKIALKYGCTGRTVANRMSELKIPRKSGAQARMRYKKFDFDGTKEEKAYLMGFRLGDLNVYLPNKKTSETLVVRCHSTIKAQVKLVDELFSKYGKITFSKAKNKRNIHVNCFLDRSFDFLMPKYNQEIRKWIFGNKILTAAFAAGYVDAEGSFKLNQGRGRFKLDSYDFDILHDLNKFLVENDIKAKFRIIAKKGEQKQGGKIWNNNLWRLNINEASSLETFIKLIFPYLRHQNRIKDVRVTLDNIKKRRKNGTIK